MKHARNTKRTTAIVGTAIVGTVMVATAAWAVFGSTIVAGANGGAEMVKEITVVGLQLNSPLLPGETSNVKLTIANPNDNVKAKITGISPGPISIGGIPADAVNTCKDYIVTSQGTLPDPLPTLAKSGGSANVTVTDGVKFGDAPLACQGMTWTTNWSVTFQAVR
ncbi:hypothetical protein [Catellatospora sichuanensis]|uniref:hypothetical protein n=1 Tax=Catellatospora sichuanensis TaxID=1969805 RepID=UPI001181CA66|nr:hypothetical protein [Catellatospora sichuanensis]